MATWVQRQDFKVPTVQAVAEEEDSVPISQMGKLWSGEPGRGLGPEQSGRPSGVPSSPTGTGTRSQHASAMWWVLRMHGARQTRGAAWTCCVHHGHGNGPRREAEAPGGAVVRPAAEAGGTDSRFQCKVPCVCG